MTELIYWPMLPGRGEFVRLVLEDIGLPYVDVARLPEDQGGGVAAVLKAVRGELQGTPPLAPPILRVGELVLAQAPLICAWLGERHGLGPSHAVRRLAVRQHLLSLANLVAEVHDTHHPISTALVYEQQQDEALRTATLFREHRLPKYLDYFERLLTHTGSGWLAGATCSAADLVLFGVLRGLDAAFPIALARELTTRPRLVALRKAVAARPGIHAYLASDRALPFNQHGIFRPYPELDG